MFSKLLIANRGEIAVRIIRTCRELGIATVAVHSEADAASWHVAMADEAICLPGETARETYLDAEKLVRAADATGAQAIHPGYGFLAEDAAFARAVELAGLVFIGPPASAIEIMGDKVAARRAAIAASLPQVPGTESIAALQDVLQFGDMHGYPVAVKASFGGGGRGMRVIHAPEEAAELLQAARRESLAAFGRDDVYLERYLTNARHVEVQVFADHHGNVVWLGDRDCSVQRRHQKLIEESPAPGLPMSLRCEMGDASVRLAAAVSYVGAGTVEFLVEDDRFYFLEMNTRIQVEHPVTEMVLGLDLVREQILVAAGERLSIVSSGPEPRGHAVEVRMNAEDVTDGLFLPTPGRVGALKVPHGPGIRFDAGVREGDEISPHFDSMVGKLIAWGPTREGALHRLRAAVQDAVVAGVSTTLPAAMAVLSHDDFIAGPVSTRWLEDAIRRGLLSSDSPAPASAAEDGESPSLHDGRRWVEVGKHVYYIPMRLAGVAGSPSDTDRAPAARRLARAGRARGAGSALATGLVVSPMQGTVVRVQITDGAVVKAGELLFVLEAMKMENPIKAAVDGVVSRVHVSLGEVVAAGADLANIEPT